MKDILENVYDFLKNRPSVSGGLSYKVYIYNDYSKSWIAKARFDKKTDAFEYMALLLHLREIVKISKGDKIIAIRLGGRVYES